MAGLVIGEGKSGLALQGSPGFIRFRQQAKKWENELGRFLGLALAPARRWPR